MLTVAMNNEERARAIVKAIAQEAEKQWGENWLPALVNAYCDIEKAETGNDKVTYANRRSQIVAALDSNPRLETVLRLAQAVGLEVQLVATRKDVIRF